MQITHLKPEQLEDNDLIQSIINNGLIIEGNKVIKEEWQSQKAKALIIKKNLRPAYTETTPDVIKTISAGCWVWYFYFITTGN